MMPHHALEFLRVYTVHICQDANANSGYRLRSSSGQIHFSTQSMSTQPSIFSLSETAVNNDPCLTYRVNQPTTWLLFFCCNVNRQSREAQVITENQRERKKVCVKVCVLGGSTAFSPALHFVMVM